MNWDQVEGKWKQMKGSVQQQWGKLTDDDMTFVGGSREKFIGRVQERYGIAKDEAQRRTDEWLKSLAETEHVKNTEKTHTGRP